MLKALTKVFGTQNDRILKRIQPTVVRINELEPKYQAMTDDALGKCTIQFRERLINGEPLDDLLPEAFAVVREAGKRVLQMRHFDVQLIGGVVLHEGKISEMRTGEGKTLVATLPAYLNALSEKGVHIVTVNDYLAKRDTEWMGQVHRFLGLSVGTISHKLNDDERKEAYNCDITYGTNNEFGFDYLRDNMKFFKDGQVQRSHSYAIVDEVDSILIDEARTPLIISGPAEKSTQLYSVANNIIPRLKKEDHYLIDEKARSAALTEDGVVWVEKILDIDNLYDLKHIDMLHHITQALRAHVLFKLDVDYIVKENEVIIVDEFTGRIMPGRRYSDGLHQALEAKEGVRIANENQTLATITFQNYFRMYDKLSGMTGTADTEATEFKRIYNLDVVVIPTNEPMIRQDYPDMVYRTRQEKFLAVTDEIVECHRKGQPVLVGTVSIDMSEAFSKQLSKRGVKHVVLNAKNHEKEAEIVAQAGQKGAVTIATNMAGRGTDIVMGEGVCELGGLHILGTERHESRRIDNQLRGRSGRQGDPGSSRFYLALEDDLLRIFGGERISSIMSRLGMQEGEPITHNMISKAVENAQRRVEGHNFEIRKQLIEYDDVMNQQREMVYKHRKMLLEGENIREDMLDMIAEQSSFIAMNIADNKLHATEWNLSRLNEMVLDSFGFDLVGQLSDEILDGLTHEGLEKTIFDAAEKQYETKEKLVGEEDFRNLERMIMLQTLDVLWKDHLLSMDHLKQGIHLRGYAQQNPLVMYKKEGLGIFEQMMESLRQQVLSTLFRVQIKDPSVYEETLEKEQKALDKLVFSGPSDSETTKKPVVRESNKTGRNDPCPCGSQKKFKKCCGQ